MSLTSKLKARSLLLRSSRTRDGRPEKLLISRGGRIWIPVLICLDTGRPELAGELWETPRPGFGIEGDGQGPEGATPAPPGPRPHPQGVGLGDAVSVPRPVLFSPGGRVRSSGRSQCLALGPCSRTHGELVDGPGGFQVRSTSGANGGGRARGGCSETGPFWSVVESKGHST
jgi:hypothetical protein